jgi:hypothetical protein
MTMPLFMARPLFGSFWPKNRQWYWTIRHIRQIWPRATFGCSQNWRPLWRATDFQTLPAFRDMRLPSCRAFQYFEQWKHRLSVLVRKETTSNMTAIIN